MNLIQLIGLGTMARSSLRELGGVFIVVFLVLLLLSLGSRFSAYLQDAMAGEISADVLWLMLSLRIPEFIQLVTPFSLFLAMLFWVGRLDSDSELPVIQAAGIGPAQVIAWLVWIVIPLAGLVAILSLLLTPLAREKFDELIASQELINELDVLKEKTFRTYHDGKSVTYMHSVDRDQGEVSGVFSNQLGEDGESMTIVATRGRYHRDAESGTRYLELVDGRQYSETSEGYIDRIAFQSLTQKIESIDLGSTSGGTSSVLTQNLNRGVPKQLMEFQWRLSLPIMTLVLALCAVGLGRLRPRSGRYDRFLPGILLLAGYYGLSLFLVSQVQVSDRLWLAQLGLWPVHISMLGLAYVFLLRSWRPS